MTAVLPQHSHDPAEYPVAQGCPRCIALAAVNPDTGTPWPPLPEDDGELVDALMDAFHDRVDGPDVEPALRAVLVRAVQQGVMRGRLREAAEARRRAQQWERTAEELVKGALESLGNPDTAHASRRELAAAVDALAFARGLRSVAGSR